MPAYPVYQVATVFSDDELAEVRFEQTADVMLFTHPAHPVQRLRRYAHDFWVWDDAPMGTDIEAPTGLTVTANITETGAPYTPMPYTYAVTAVDGETGQESQPSTEVTVDDDNDLTIRGNTNVLAWTAVSGASEYRVYGFRAGSYGYIGTATTNAFTDDNIAPDYSIGVPVATDPFASDENPACVTFHNGRSAFGRTPLKPNGIFLSRPDDIFNHDYSRPQASNDGIEFQLRGRGLNVVQHLVSMGDLMALTNNAIFAILPTSDGVLTPTNVGAEPQGRGGVSYVRPELVADTLFYRTINGDAVRTLGYTFEVEGYRGNDITVFAPHFFTGFTGGEMSYVDTPMKTLWTVRSDGKAPVLTWQAEQEVWGWTLCETEGLIESVCAVSENGWDTLYAVIQREIDGESLRYVERLAYPHWIDENWSAVEEAVIVDAAMTVEGDPTATVTGLEHLEGCTVSVLADGYAFTGLVVTDGAVTIDDGNLYERITVGLPYTGYMTSLPLVSQDRGGVTKGRPQIASNAAVEVMNTRDIEIGIGLDVGELFIAPVPQGYVREDERDLITGTYDPMGIPPGDWREATVTVRQSRPLPMVVLGIFPDLRSGG